MSESNQKAYTPPPVTGYRNLTQEEVDLMNKIKAIGEQVGGLVSEIKAHKDTDPRWVAIATTDLQKGFMSLTRAVAKPTSF